MAGARTKLTCMRRAKPGLAASKGRVFARLDRALFACILAAFLAPLASLQPAFGQAQTSLEQIVKPPKVDPSEPKHPRTVHGVGYRFVGNENS